MYISVINQLFSEAVVRAFCWTLVHSFWQGLLLAILAGLLILLTRRSAPVLRYNLLAALFLLFLAGAGVTFALELGSGQAGYPTGSRDDGAMTVTAWGPHAAGVVQQITGGPQTANDGQPTAGIIQREGASIPWTERLAVYCNEHASFIVITWLFLLSFRLIGMVAGLATIQRIRKYRTIPSPESWQVRIGELASKLGIDREVRLLESAFVKVPMVAGLLKPVILIPLGLLAQLPPEQVEAILLHELAHIRRKDMFMNLIQSFGEALFFFHPGVRWVSSLIREERENCCDDIAVGFAKNKKEFIRALVSFQEFMMTPPRYAVALSGSRNSLLQRTKRILYRDNKRLDIRERVLLLGCMLIISVLTFAFSYTSGTRISPGKSIGRLVEPVKESSVAEPATPEIRNTGISLTDTAVLPKPARRPVRASAARDTLSPVAAEKLRQRLAEEQRELQEEHERLEQRLIEEQKLLQDEHEKLQLRLAEEQRELQEKQHKLLLRLAEEERNLQEKQQKFQQQLALQNLDEHQLKLMRLDEQKLRSDRLLKSPGLKNRFASPIIEQMLEKKIINNADDVSFELNKDGLTVNGVKQSDEVAKPFIEQYITDPRNKISYSKKPGGGETTSVSEYK